MAQCKLTPQEFIQNTFSPMVAVMCSPLVEQACRKNNLSFIELLQPFCKLSGEAQMKDSTGTTVTIRNMRITITDVNARPPQPTLARKYLNSSVTLASDIRTVTMPIQNYVLEIPSVVPWFEAWRETFLQVQFPSDHEFTKHFLACVLVISSSEPSPLDTLNHMTQTLTQLQSNSQKKLPKWFSSNTLRYYVILHDAIDGNNDIAVKTMESLKQSYGVVNCFLLQMNSRPPGAVDDPHLPDPWSQFLVRKPEMADSSENESPRTPADSGGVTSMPNSVSTHMPSLSGTNTSPTMNRSILQKIEVAQDATVTYHPLSPEAEIRAVNNEEEDVINMPINSNVWQGAATTPTIMHGACLTTDDIEQLKLLVHEFVSKSLIPHVEKLIQQISDIISNKKGVSRSLFSATKRWFTPNKPGVGGSTTAINTLLYANDSPEIQLRKLGDLYFMFGHYSMAFQAYHSAKRDFNTDQAWLYYAGALEMAALSAFMNGEVTRKTRDYMEESIIAYLNNCNLPQFATRATLLSTECLKGKSQYGDAAHQFIRMTSEDSDLRSALLLEQAAYCFLHCTKPKMVRKYAFHIVLAGHRFSKCLQRKHSLRCYRQAFQVYNSKGWSLAEDHIHYTIGRQASNVKQLEEATVAFSKLLSPTSKQNAQQQAIFLKEYLNAHYHLMKDNTAPQQYLPILPLPLLEDNETKVLLGPQPPLSKPGKIPASGINFTTDVNDIVFQKWNKLEEMMVQESCGSQPMVFKPLITFYSNKNSSSTKPIAVMGEPVQISILLQNMLQIILPLKDIYLLWKFTGKNGESDILLQNECTDISKTDAFIKTHYLKSVNLQPNCKEEIVLSVTPLVVGELLIQGVCYTITNPSQESWNGVVGKQVFQIRGPKLKTKEKEGQPLYGIDKRLEITITPSGPCLQVSFSEISQELLANELQNITIELRNCGSTPLHNIMMASSMPQLFSFSTSTTNFTRTNLDEILDNPALREKEFRKNHIIKIVLPQTYNGQLEPGQSYSMNLWLRAPPVKGPALIDVLFYYENVNNQCMPRYRLVRHLWHLSIQDSLKLNVTTRHSSGCNDVESLIMSLKATNNNQIHHAVISEITLLSASLISHNWKLYNNFILPKDVKLQSEESLHCLLKAYRSVSTNAMSNFSEVTFLKQTNVKEDVRQSRLNFAYRNSFYHLNAFENDDRNKNVEATLVLGWHALVNDSAGNKRTVIGQHHIQIEKLIKLETISKDLSTNSLLGLEGSLNVSLKISDPNVDNLQSQIVYSLAHSTHIKHNFQKEKICIVPVQLILHSSSNKQLVVKVNTLEIGSSLKTDSPNIITSSNFHWIGHCDFVHNLNSFSSHRIPLKAAFIGPGTYNLGGRLQISCHPPDNLSETILQACRVHSGLIVEHCSEK